MDLAALIMRILVVNVGSSSLKLSVLDGDRLLDTLNAPRAGGKLGERDVAKIAAEHAPIDAVGHRIVHGGAEFTAPVIVDDRVRARLQALTDLAPLHLPPSLDGLDLVRRLLPGTPAVACFDTTFHVTVPAAAATYALPREWRARWPLRRFGFHGLSHAWASSRAAEMAGRDPGDLRVVTCHLGAGASLAAVQDGVSVDTTMGFTPLEGLVMATRSGSVDPGLILWLEEHAGLPPAELTATLEHRSGLLGLAGSADMRAVLDAEARGDHDAALAVGVYLHRLRASVAAMAAAMNGLDALVFTAGVGEHSPDVRAAACQGLEFLGVELDASANAGCRPDADVARAAARVRVLVIATREDLTVVRETVRVLGQA